MYSNDIYEKFHDNRNELVLVAVERDFVTVLGTDWRGRVELHSVAFILGVIFMVRVQDIAADDPLTDYFRDLGWTVDPNAHYVFGEHVCYLSKFISY
jgi:hypothetical protein